MSFHFINIVWGKTYTKLFLDYYLATQLSPNNLPQFSSMEGVTYKLYVPPDYQSLILQHPTYQKLCQTIKTELKIFNIPKNYFKYRHKVMNYCHQHSVIEACLSDAVMVFLSPDSIWSDGSFLRILDLWKEGKRLVLVSSMRAEKKGFLVSYINKYCPESSTEITVSNQDLVKMTLENLHPLTQANFVDSDYFSQHPSHLFWKVNEDEILARCFHLHPIMIYPKKHKMLPFLTIDDDYISQICSWEETKIINDSDDIFVCEVSRHDFAEEFYNTKRMLTIKELTQWMRQRTNESHRKFVKTKIKIHSQPLSKSWQEVAEESDELVDKVLNDISCKGQNYGN